MRRAASVALGGAVLTLAALTFGAAPLFVPGIAFLVLGLLTPVVIKSAAGAASVKRRLLTDRVLEGEPLEAAIELRRGPLCLPGAELLDPLAGRPVALGGALSPIRGGRSASVRVVARFPRRGRRRVDPPSLLAKDPLGLAHAVKRGTGVDEVLVLPRTEVVRWNGASAPGDSDSLFAGMVPEPMAAAELDGLRPYRPSSPASRIHWPALARGAGLLERRLRADGDMRPLVALDVRSAGRAEHVDAAVRAAASLTLELARRNGCGLLLPGERRALEIDPNLDHWPAAHVRLALIDGGPAARAPALASTGRLGLLLYVAADRLQRLPPGLSVAGSQAVLLVVPSELARGLGAVSFEVAGCVGVKLSHGRQRRRWERAA